MLSDETSWACKVLTSRKNAQTKPPNSTEGGQSPKRTPPARRFSIDDVWARWAVRVATTNDPWARHVAEFYRRLARQETHHEP